MENYLGQLDDIMALSFKLVREHLQTAQLCQKTYYDRRVHGKPYQVGYLIWRSIKSVRKGRTWSLSPRLEGPYKVIEVLSEVNYQIHKFGKRNTVVEHETGF